MLAQVQPQGFVLLADPESHQRLESEQNHGSARSCECNGRADGNQLRHNQAWVAIKQSIVSSRVDRFRSKYSGQDRAKDAADSVHADNVQRIVVPEYRLQET